MQNIILQTNTGNKPTSDTFKVLKCGEVLFDIGAWQTFLVLPKWKISTTSLKIPQ